MEWNIAAAGAQKNGGHGVILYPVIPRCLADAEIAV